MSAVVAVAGLLAFPILLGVLGQAIDRLSESAFDRLFRFFGFKDSIS